MTDPDIRSRARLPILAVTLTTAGFITLKTGRDALYFQEDALSQLPWAYIWMAIASMPAAMIHLRSMSRWGPRKTRTGAFLLSALLLLTTVPLLAPENRLVVSALFVLIPTVFSALFAGAWLLAGDLLEGSPRSELAWAYSRIGAGSMIGGILGGCRQRLFLPALRHRPLSRSALVIWLLLPV